MESVSFAWELPTVNLDGSPLTDLAGGELAYGTESGVYPTSIDVGMATTWTVDGLTAGQTYYFAGRAYNTDGKRGEYCAEIVWTAPQTPGQWTFFRLAVETN